MLEVLWNVNWRDVQHSQATMNQLLRLCLSRNDKLLTWLLEKGAQVDTETVKQAVYSSNNVPKMKIVVEKYGISRLKDAMQGTVAFLVAAREGKLEAMRFFLDAGLDVEQVGPLLDEREAGPYTALCEAIRGQQVEMVQLLLDRGAKWDTPCGGFDMTPWKLASQQGNSVLLGLLEQRRKDSELEHGPSRRNEL